MTGKIDDLENRIWHCRQQLISVLPLHAGNGGSLSQAASTSDPGSGLFLPYTVVPPDFRLTSILRRCFPVFYKILSDASQWPGEGDGLHPYPVCGKLVEG